MATTGLALPTRLRSMHTTSLLIALSSSRRTTTTVGVALRSGFWLSSLDRKADPTNVNMRRDNSSIKIEKVYMKRRHSGGASSIMANLTGIS